MSGIVTNKGTVIDQKSDSYEIARLLFSEGLDARNYIALSKALSLNHPAVRVAIDLKKAGLLKTGCSQAFEVLYPKEIWEDPLAGIQGLVNANKTLFKIIAPSYWGTFLSHMKDYSKRATLRDPYRDKRVATHKFVSLSGKVVPYVPKRRVKNSEEYLQRGRTKKTSTTKLSRCPSGRRIHESIAI